MYFTKNKRFANINRLPVLGVFLLFLVSTQTLAAQVFDEVVACVNGDIITKNQLKEEIHLLERETGKRIEGIKELEREVLQILIENTLLKQEAEKQGFTVSEMELQKTLENFQDEISQEKSEKEVKERVREKILREKLLNWKVKKLREKIWIEDDKIKDFFLSLKEYMRGISLPKDQNVINFYNTYKENLEEEEKLYIAQIIVKDKKRAGIIFQNLKEGESFSSLAKKFSVGPGAEKGGDVGWVKLSEIEDSLKSTLRMLEEGEFTKPLEVKQGYYRIIQVKERKEISFQRWEDKIRNYLLHIELSKLLQQWIKRLKEESFIQIIDDALKMEEE